MRSSVLLNMVVVQSFSLSLRIAVAIEGSLDLFHANSLHLTEGIESRASIAFTLDHSFKPKPGLDSPS